MNRVKCLFEVYKVDVKLLLLLQTLLDDVSQGEDLLIA